LDLADFRVLLAQLPFDQREALVLVGATGFTYEEAAKICGVPIGTIKSRVNRARQRLMQQMAINSPDDFGPDLAVVRNDYYSTEQKSSSGGE
jgi:RNA polymerase sigma-70 factor (ECF subfamily)